MTQEQVSPRAQHMPTFVDDFNLSLAVEIDQHIAIR